MGHEQEIARVVRDVMALEDLTQFRVPRKVDVEVGKTWASAEELT